MAETAWACIAPEWATPPCFILENSVSYYRDEAQRYVGEAWAHDGETPSQGWKRAYRAGWRCERIKLERMTT